SAQIREILISESAWEEMTCLFAPSLGDFIKIPVRTYSSGMVLRLGFSISTAINPEILLMDEWMSVGDSDFKRKAEMRLNSFISKAGIMVMATHDDELAKSVCNKFIRLEHGEIVSKGGF
ncbi:hypothetical protein AIY94_21465, partial [Salmonella enterica subsp. enterica serovar Typhimurium]